MYMYISNHVIDKGRKEGSSGSNSIITAPDADKGLVVGAIQRGYSISNDGRDGRGLNADFPKHKADHLQKYYVERESEKVKIKKEKNLSYFCPPYHNGWKDEIRRKRERRGRESVTPRKWGVSQQIYNTTTSIFCLLTNL